MDTFSDGKFNGKVYFLNKLIIDRKYEVIRNLVPFLPHFPNYVKLPSIFDAFQKMNIAIEFPIGKYIWIPSFSIVVKLVVMLHALIAYLLFKMQLPLCRDLITN